MVDKVDGAGQDGGAQIEVADRGEILAADPPTVTAIAHEPPELNGSS